MKIMIDHWGPIEHCEYDLEKSLIITYGENNIGKSYAMQLIYLLLKHMIWISKDTLKTGGRYILRPGLRLSHRAIQSMVMEFQAAQSEKERDVTKEILELFSQGITQTIIPEFEKSLQNTFGTYSLLLEQKPKVLIDFGGGDSILFDLKERNATVKWKLKPVFLKRSNSDFHKSRELKNHYDIFLFENHIETPIEKVGERVKILNREFAYRVLSEVNAVYFLPASRSGIYAGISSFSSIFAELAKNRSLIRGSIQIPALSEPISDYFEGLSTIRFRRGYCYEAATEIEHDILKGQVAFDKKNKNIMYISDETGVAMEMRDVSSMVSEVSPITAYLKYIVGDTGLNYSIRRAEQFDEEQSSSVIFIEEPEAHLHPINQVKLIKIFVKLAKNNVKMIMSSHSNYIFNQLNNLILGGELSQDIYEPVLMRQINGVTNTEIMKTDELGTDDDNFSDIANQLYEEREELILKYMERENTEE